MSRLPFNPQQMAAARRTAAGVPGDQGPLTVSQVGALVRDALAIHCPAKLQVVGEVSNFSDRTHWFFSLKDEESTLRCVMFASAARRAVGRGWVLENGHQVVATGRLDYYGAQGQLQLYVDKLEPVGQGALELQYRQLCEQLRKQGYFDADRKRDLPLLPRRVAVVTSQTGAALQDVINTAHTRWAACRLAHYDVFVQGAEAAPAVAAAINLLSKDGPGLGIDVIILTRGGGSIEDLWAFNDRIVADAIFRCRVPVVAAIGHETDTTIAELVADVRCATPTQAAMHVIPDAAALLHQLHQYSQRLHTITDRSLRHGHQRLASLARHPIFRRPQTTMQPLRDRLDRAVEHMMHAGREALKTRKQWLMEQQSSLAQIEPAGRVRLAQQRTQAVARRLITAVTTRLTAGHVRVDAMARQLDALGPRNVLKRGYSYTQGPDGKLLRRVEDAHAGDRIITTLVDGRVTSRVEEGSKRRRGGQKSKSKTSGADGAGQLGLFE